MATLNRYAARKKLTEVLLQLRRPPDSVAEYERLAHTYATAGAVWKAIAICGIILEMEPSHTHTQRMLADLYALRDQSASAGATLNVDVRTLPTLALFSDLEKDVFVSLIEKLERRQYAAGHNIIREGDAAQSMFILVEGEVAVVREPAAHNVPVARMRSGTIFGEMALVTTAPRLSSVYATVDCVVLELPRATLESIALRYPLIEQTVQHFYRSRILASLLRSNHIIASLSPSEKQDLVSAFASVTVQAGTALLTQGRPGDGVYLILRGHCGASSQDTTGQRSAYPRMREGDMFGEISAMTGKPCTATVQTESVCTLLRVSPETFRQIVLRNPNARHMVESLGLERLERTASVDPTEGLLAEYLL